MDHPSLSQLADEETPTPTSRNLGTSKRVVEEDEEDYNDISSKIDAMEYFWLLVFAVLLIECPVNSTTVENHSGASCHQPLEFSIISGPMLPAQVPERSDLDQMERSTVSSTTTGVSRSAVASSTTGVSRSTEPLHLLVSQDQL